MSLMVDGQLKFGAYAICTGNQHGFTIAAGNFRHSGEPPESCQHLRAMSGFAGATDTSHQFGSGINIYAGRFIGQAAGWVGSTVF